MLKTFIENIKTKFKEPVGVKYIINIRKTMGKRYTSGSLLIKIRA